MLRTASVFLLLTALVAPIAALPAHVSLLQTAMKAKRGGVTEMSVLNGERPEESCKFASDDDMPEFPDDIDDEAMLAQVRLMQKEVVRKHGPSDSLHDDIMGDNVLDDDEALGLLEAAMAM
eukprot:TRINITY_DN114245_c0_g1_i1.p1 TRINITY_DN114245_c0_g1~~TRINITY_DN114245_c0_g1_i1.p1  ORF type:complete len:121 (+),score=39.20 TRINITY_DN114245_c0_g1_i1:103-465(+)